MASETTEHLVGLDPQSAGLREMTASLVDYTRG
jgi:hypothetical protein